MSEIKSLFPLTVIATCVISSVVMANTDNNDYRVTLPTIEVMTTEDTHHLKGYMNYREASVTRNHLSSKETPQTIDILNIQKNKNYGTNDLSSILEGNAGIDASYDMRGESIYLRGFQVDANGIYRDGIRESGQVRRSTANIERVEILKGPASVLYGRSSGGGIINMISKSANFKTSRNIGLSYGSWKTRAMNMDINQVVNDNVAVRLTGEWRAGNSFRQGVSNKNQMISPSMSIISDDGRLSWTGQYTYDNVWRIPDRNPEKSVYDQMELDYTIGFARAGDYVKDKSQIWRSDFYYMLNDKWNIQWLLGYRTANQDFDHYYAGTFSQSDQMLSQTYAWQKTKNTTLSNSLTLNGEFNTSFIEHKITLGIDYSREKRNPILATLRNQKIDPYNPSSWTRTTRPNATINNQHKANSVGVFLQDLIGLTPTFKVILGGRYDHYRFHSTNINQLSRHYKGNTFSPNAGIVWDITDNHTFYVSYNKSFSPYGGRSYLGVSTDQAEIFNTDPEYSKQYEIGIKSTWLENKLSTTLSGYRLTHYNIRYRSDPVNNLYLWQVRGKERSQGIELSTIGQVMSNLYMRTSLGWLDSEILEDKSKPINEGRQLNATSRFNGNLFLRYLVNEHLYGEIGVTRVGKRFFYNERQNTAYYIPSFNRIDAMIGWNFEPISVTFAVSNLSDKQYLRSNAMLGNGRSYTLRINYHF
ncbi:TonB-dependent receptor [Volucribacter amazonae]|uniref:TonB-dependent receptor n=1 Tax=Volucribacter amazonae TaxID=256731 RepID=UPI002441B94C|nr:TonB-dependent receptor [Volucribacter amazonae]